MTTQEQIIQRAAALPVANIGDALGRLYVVNSRVKPMWDGARVAGRAYTALTPAGDNRAIHEAIDDAAPGEVLVVAAGGYPNRALIGELMSLRAVKRKLNGMVLDGAIRDVRDIEEIQLPVFAVGSSPAGPYRNGPGLRQVPVAIGDVAVMPGDLIVGDQDGVAVIPWDRAEEVLDAAEAKHQAELEQRRKIEECV